MQKNKSVLFILGLSFFSMIKTVDGNSDFDVIMNRKIDSKIAKLKLKHDAEYVKALLQNMPYFAQDYQNNESQVYSIDSQGPRKIKEWLEIEEDIDSAEIKLANYIMMMIYHLSQEEQERFVNDVIEKNNL